MFRFTNGEDRITIDSVDIRTSKNGKVRCFGIGTKVTENSELEAFEEQGAGFDTFEALAAMLEKSRKSLSGKKNKKELDK